MSVSFDDNRDFMIHDCVVFDPVTGAPDDIKALDGQAAIVVGIRDLPSDPDLRVGIGAPVLRYGPNDFITVNRDHLCLARRAEDKTEDQRRLIALNWLDLHLHAQEERDKEAEAHRQRQQTDAMQAAHGRRLYEFERKRQWWKLLGDRVAVGALIIGSVAVITMATWALLH